MSNHETRLLANRYLDKRTHLAQTQQMSEAEALLTRLESKNRSYRASFCLALSGLTVLVVAGIANPPPDVIRTKKMVVMDGNNAVLTLSVLDGKIVFGTSYGTKNLVSVGEGTTNTGVMVLSGATNKDLIRLGTTKGGGGSIGVNGADGVEVDNASPNITQSGSLFIQSSTGALFGEINGDKQNGGAIVVHNASGAEIARVHN